MLWTLLRVRGEDCGCGQYITLVFRVCEALTRRGTRGITSAHVALQDVSCILR